MKRTLFTFAALLFCLNAYCQTLSFKDIVHLHDRKNAKEYLESKSFIKFDSDNGKSVDYVINGRTDKEETITVASQNRIAYRTSNISYAEALFKQIKNKYRKISGFDEPNFKLYQFGDPHFLITVNIEKGKSFQSIAIEWK